MTRPRTESDVLIMQPSWSRPHIAAPISEHAPFIPKPRTLSLILKTLHHPRTFSITPSVIVFFAFSDPARSTCGKAGCRCRWVLRRCGWVLCRCG
jgi:hypothetical protein